MVDAPERIWIEAGYGCPYFYEAYELPEAGSPVTGYIRADLVEALEAERARAEKAEAERGQAIKALSKAAEARGRAEGKLAASELPGIIDGWKACAEKAEAAMQRVVDAAVPETLTDAQINDACMSYRHDFVLLEDDEREIVKFQCREWWRSIRRALRSTEASHDD